MSGVAVSWRAEQLSNAGWSLTTTASDGSTANENSLKVGAFAVPARQTKGKA